MLSKIFLAYFLCVGIFLFLTHFFKISLSSLFGKLIGNKSIFNMSIFIISCSTISCPLNAFTFLSISNSKTSMSLFLKMYFIFLVAFLYSIIAVIARLLGVDRALLFGKSLITKLIHTRSICKFKACKVCAGIDIIIILIFSNSFF